MTTTGIRYAPNVEAHGSSQLPNWLWTLIGCLSVLVIGFAGLWWTSSSGMLAIASRSNDRVDGTASGNRSASGRIQVEQLEARAPAPAPAAPTGLVRGNEARRQAPRPRPPAATTPATSSPRVAKAGASAAPGGKAAAGGDEKAGGAAQGGDGEGEGQEREAAEAPAPKQAATAAVHDVSPAAADTAAMPAVLREISGPDDEQPREAAPKEVVEAALTALAPRVRRCFFKFQIPGRAQVRVVAPPAGGAAESVTVSGDFEGTPTGECVAAEIGGAALPSFKGSPLKVNHTYVLR